MNGSYDFVFSRCYNYWLCFKHSDYYALLFFYEVFEIVQKVIAELEKVIKEWDAAIEGLFEKEQKK
ncbi:hypothetical protein D1093_08305 [Bartonella kosoyi]|uniref:Uncharacterized protein n=1 Tax=Bartonella kosoyi TaxID=2133959 RepID=A0A5B9CZQ2_9HYPH|nr:hypothetical protein [Bartonella kosoyi]QEE09600.1 hypothetical protein D1093_08305 [Bartonella kosoyi]